MESEGAEWLWCWEQSVGAEELSGGVLRPHQHKTTQKGFSRLAETECVSLEVWSERGVVT